MCLLSSNRPVRNIHYGDRRDANKQAETGGISQDLGLGQAYRHFGLVLLAKAMAYALHWVDWCTPALWEELQVHLILDADAGREEKWDHLVLFIYHGPYPKCVDSETLAPSIW